MTTARVPRLLPLPLDEWDEHRRNLLRGHLKLADRYLSGEPGAPRLPNVLGVLGHHAELAGAWLACNGVLVDRPTLNPRDRELMILRVAWRTSSDYAWHQHVRLAGQAGVTREEIDAVGGDPAAGPWSPVQLALLESADQMIDHHRVDDETWERLARHFDSRSLLEILFVVGTTACMAMVSNSVGLQPDPASSRETEERP